MTSDLSLIFKSGSSGAEPTPTRDRILRAGAELLAGPGLGEVNTNTVARAAGVGVGTFYTHFEDKFALHRELMALGLAALQQALARASEATRTAVVDEQVRATVAAFVDFARDHPALYRVLFARGHGRPGTGRVGVGFSSRAMENRLRELQAAGRLDAELDPAIAARVFTAGQGQILLWWLDAPDPVPRSSLIETLIRLHPAVACQR